MSDHDSNRRELYHIRLLKNYIEYLKKYYPDLNLDEILGYAGLTRYQLDDAGYWCTQEQADRFHRIIDEKTGHPNISREVGRYAAISATYGTIRQYVFGFISISTAYSMVQKITNQLSRGMRYRIRPLGQNRMEAISTPTPGTQEKPYQCENRIGLLEALAKPFTGEFAKVEHPECYHKGGSCCRYIVSWYEPPYLKFKHYRNLITVFGLMLLLILEPILGLGIYSFILMVSYVVIIMIASMYALSSEKSEISRRLEIQGEAAEQLMEESNKRYKEAQLVHEMGQAISKVIDIDNLLTTVMALLEKHLDFKHGMVLLANPEKTRLVFRAGFGFTEEQEKVLAGIQLHLDKPGSRGAFVVAFRDQVPYLVDNIHEIKHDLSERTSALVDFLGTASFICVPIIYESESLGILSVDNDETKGPPKQSDLNLLMGIAPQIAISINNARTFEKMQASEEKYRDLVESANSIILRISTQGAITFANRYAQEFYGYSESEMLGQNVMGFILPEKDVHGRALFPVIREFLAHPEEYASRENENMLRNGQRVWVSWSNKAIYDKNGQLAEILCVGNDITARKKAEYEKRQLESQLIRAQKMEAIGSLAGGVAHDLNNILSGITSYPELLLLELPDDSPMRKAVVTIKKTGEKAAAMVQDLLTLARRGVSTSNAVDLNVIVRDYFESPEFDRLKEYHPNMNVELRLDDGLKYILGSEIHLGKTLMNLVSNAAEAMPDGGTVIVRTENVYLDEPLKGYDTVDRGEYAVLSVADTGIGISDEDLKKIFEPFFSKKVMGRSGTGLGMTVVWSTVKDHNGYINVESEEGSGTRFDLYFPVTRHLVKEKADMGSLEDYSGSGHILVVDDAEEQREITKSVLRKIGYHVDTARCGEEALDYLKGHHADLVILDMIMDPGMDGLETYQKILDMKGAQKAIIVSGFSETDRVKKALALGVGTYIRKPYSLNDLARAVKAELERR